MRHDEPVPKDGLGKQIQDGIDNSLRVDAHSMGIRRCGPDAVVLCVSTTEQPESSISELYSH
jgi:hypothetical protein